MTDYDPPCATSGLQMESVNAPSGSPKGMIKIAGGCFEMGSNDFYPEERPAHRVDVKAFWIDVHPVTNSEFRRFVEASGYVTIAERTPNPLVLTLLVPPALRLFFRHRLGVWALWIQPTVT